MNRSPCVLVLESFFCLFFLTHVCHVKCDSLSRAGRSSNCPVIVNGCSTPGNLPFVYKTLFTPACTKHDCLLQLCKSLWLCCFNLSYLGLVSFYMLFTIIFFSDSCMQLEELLFLLPVASNYVRFLQR